MAKRPAIKKSIRFEVFKRDSFACQYCGKKAPDVILEIDHINPVVKGGDNEILNLITSCEDCNSGKSDKLLSETTIIDKQRKQIEQLQERKNQIEMMLRWKMALSEMGEDEANNVVDYCNTKSIYYHLSDEGEKTIKSIVKKYGAIKTCEAIDESFEKYYSGGNNGDNYSYVIDKIKGIARLNALSPEDRAKEERIIEVLRFARSKFYTFDYLAASKAIHRFKSISGDIDLLEEITNRCEKFSDWKSELYYA